MVVDSRSSHSSGRETRVPIAAGQRLLHYRLVEQKLFSPRLRGDFLDAAADGQRFRLVERIDPDIRSITLTQNWATSPGGD